MTKRILADKPVNKGDKMELQGILNYCKMEAKKEGKEEKEQMNK